MVDLVNVFDVIEKTGNDYTILERARLVCGLSRTQMLTTLGIKPGNVHLFMTPDRVMDQTVVMQAIALLGTYAEWSVYLEKQVREALAVRPYLTTHEFGQICGLDDMHVYKLAERHVVTPTVSSGGGSSDNDGDSSKRTAVKRSIFTYDDAIQSLNNMLTWLACGQPSHTRGPLSVSFLRYLDNYRAGQNVGVV